MALFATTLLQAQDAKSLLKEVSAKAKSYDNITIDFKYNLNNSKENVNQETRGNVTLQGDKYVLNMLGTTRLFDGKNIYTVVPEDEEVTISAYNPKKRQRSYTFQNVDFLRKRLHL
jgi:outer membrane lipoprotein-sorting protein